MLSRFIIELLKPERNTQIDRVRHELNFKISVHRYISSVFHNINERLVSMIFHDRYSNH